jgi:hypothetical protein
MKTKYSYKILPTISKYLRQKFAYHFKSSFSGYKIAAMLLVATL